MHIAKIPATTDPHEFYTNYFQPEIPVIITGISNNWPARKMWANGRLLKKLHEDGVHKNTLWYETARSFMSDDYEIPALVKKCLDPRFCYMRPAHCRLWISPNDHTTDFHHDGNALFVFNVQVIGRKRWAIISPDTPLTNYPFSHIALTHYQTKRPNVERHTSCTFELCEGEMLYLPAFWSHSVTALAKENVNLNWVGTKKDMRSSVLFRREREMLKCALSIPFLVKPLSYMDGTYLTHYGGSTHLASELARPISNIAMWRRLLSEYTRIPMLLKDFRRLKMHY
jgi:hypothetical protein